ncbi:hypothetical protein D9757_007692 [Collybiopsis confluens]|uniref:Uncharacterized protein n=1 Tax=Collybiopsis confluens TaxID=2823264 RepID=A0A8H5H5F3_9AGAR|nr:hypothetical protein D9757_007692 [Collybiopsis confluens]
MHRNLLAVCLFAALPTIIAQSTTSLYIPGFDSQPIDASMAGVDSSGQTTWLLSPGPVTADEDSGFVGTVTLVEGSDSAHLTYAGPDVSLGIDCALASGLAVCSGSADGTVATETETIVSIAVALASGTAAPASATATTGQSSVGTLVPPHRVPLALELHHRHRLVPPKTLPNSSS